MRRFGFAIAIFACLGAAPSPSRLTPAKQAELLHRWALEALNEGTPEGRQRATRDLMDAIALEPAEADHWLLLGRVRVVGEYDEQSRECFRRAIVLDPKELTAYLELAAAWKREWARTLDTLALRRAIGVLDTAVLLRPHASEPWLRLVPLRYEVHDYAGAAQAASLAMAGRPRRTEAQLAGAYLAFYQGDIERSDELFRKVIPLLDPGIAPVFKNPQMMLGGSAPSGEWDGLDPDPTSVENELQLEYWSRVAHAFLLFYDADRQGVDARFQAYIQYGAPQWTGLNPVGMSGAAFRTFASNLAPIQGHEKAEEKQFNAGKPPVEFPTPIQVWEYPDLGMRLVLQDRSLHGRFQPQANYEFDPLSRPDPGILAGRHDLIGLGDGAAVFHRLPPPERRIDTRGVVARFGGVRNPRVVAQVEVAGTPADSLRARWVITDRTDRPVARGSQVLGVDPCDPAELRTAQFDAELPPGEYHVTISVRGPGGKRGLFDVPTVVQAEARGMDLSDLVLACGDPSILIGGASARFDANVEGRFGRSGSIAGYLEIYRLSPGRDGLSHFDYVCNVRRAFEGPPARGKDSRPILASTSREESQPGSIRRQFVVVPVQSLAPGRYELEVLVNDQISGARARRSAEFILE